MRWRIRPRIGKWKLNMFYLGAAAGSCGTFYMMATQPYPKPIIHMTSAIISGYMLSRIYFEVYDDGSKDDGQECS